MHATETHTNGKQNSWGKKSNLMAGIEENNVNNDGEDGRLNSRGIENKGCLWMKCFNKRNNVKTGKWF